MVPACLTKRSARPRQYPVIGQRGAEAALSAKDRVGRIAPRSARTRSKPLDGALRYGNGAPQPRTIGRIEDGIRGRDCARPQQRARLLQLRPNSRLSRSAGGSYWHIEKALRLNPYDPNSANFYWSLGMCHLLLNEPDRAIEFLTTARAGTPRGYYAHMSLAGAFGL